MNQRDFFDNIAKEWDNTIEVNEEKINILLSKLDIKENERVLDVGTGTGVLIPFIKKLNKNGYIRGVDLSNGMLEVARKKYKHISNLDFEIIDVENKTKIIKTLVKNNLSKKYQYLLNT